MTTTTKAKTRRKRCSECGELKEEVLGRQPLCEKCEEGKDYCTICDEWADRSWGGGCRHVGWSREHGCSAGCGTDHIDAKDHKQSFMLLLDCLALAEESTWDDDGRYISKPAMPKILACIEANNFWTTWHGPLIGGPPDLELRHMIRNDCCVSICTIRSSDQLTWTNIGELQLGMSWLTSLDDKSVKANAITAGWIREWLKNPGQASKDAEIAKERTALIAELGRNPKSKHKAIFKALGVPGNSRGELDGVSIETLRRVAERFKP